ncbi:microvitellogenin [Helicoverpa armigera]|uniref:microvitellogenin n=1 Tax=Helicoverpa armigera TaxID=29058 RepID=UPI0030834F4C
MHSISAWKLARRPNYVTNKDKTYPYSEVPYLGEYNLVKIPLSLNNLIEHVDYWGEGRITTTAGISGFSDCYNVNHVYQLVSNGADRDRKIPNRIPVVNYTNCDTSSYIKDNSVKTVTIMGAPINTSCAKDIARIVNSDLGQVIAYGFEKDSQYSKNLINELNKKAIFHCPKYTLPTGLRGLTLFDSELAFLNLTAVKDHLYNNISAGSYDVALELTKNMNNDTGRPAIGEVVYKLIREAKPNVMAYALKLWNSEDSQIIGNSFPAAFSLIFKGDAVTITNMEYQQALKLNSNVDSKNDRFASGDRADKTSKTVSWKFVPMWVNDNVVFKICNMESNLYLKLDAETDSLGDRKVMGSSNDNETNHQYFVEPLMKDETLVFRLINCEHHQALKMDVNVDSNGDRLLWGHNGDPRGQNNTLNWVVHDNTKVWEKGIIEI